METFRLRKRKSDEKACISCSSEHDLQLPLERQISKYCSICFSESTWLGIFPLKTMTSFQTIKILIHTSNFGYIKVLK